MKITNIIKRIGHPQHWLLEKDIHDMEQEIQMMEQQLPAFKKKLDELYTIKRKYQD